MFRGVSATFWSRNVFGVFVLFTAFSQATEARPPLNGDNLLLIQSTAQTQGLPTAEAQSPKEVQITQSPVATSSCSGFVIHTASGFKVAVSAAHCDSKFQNSNSGVFASIILQRAKSSSAGVESAPPFLVRGNPFQIGFGQDVALLGIPGDAFTATASLPLAKESLSHMEPLFVGGFPRGQGPVFANCFNMGPVLSEEIPLGSRSNVDVWIECPSFRNGPANGGISGGPVVNARGEAVGVLVRERQVHSPSGAQISTGFFIITPLMEENISLERGYTPHTFDGEVTLPFADQQHLYSKTTVNLRDGRIEGTVRVTGPDGVKKSKLFRDGRKFAEMDID